ncbi:MAG: helix-turn-helix domain-containing protein [Verrucomicrobiales bacterium]|jgi:transcriptional regulator with XRE-family HTH domain|nr:helix-turn-helix domain-containing protein [Verrucomicrobiales bacterium]
MKSVASAKTFGNNIRRLRVARKLTQEKLAEACDLCLRYIQKLEGGVKTPSLETLLRLRKTLKCGWPELMAKL